ncbi:MAG: hypothetical protein FWF80_03340 [Defluviitaleaceae bacterium]|nr:hypothetical protein [Defluviitaleaceae bacterium]
MCKSKHRTRVEYTLKSSNSPIGVATYSNRDSLPNDLQALLPSPDEIARIVGAFDDEVGLFGFSGGGEGVNNFD